MSADLNTSITIQGSGDELLAVLDVLKMYEKKHYRTKYVDARLQFIRLTYEGEEKQLAEVKKRDRDRIQKSGGTLEIEASGPYGSFYPVDETRVFENIADAAPNSSFTGKVEGFVSGADVIWEGNLKEGKLYLKYTESNWDEGPEAKYSEMLYEKLPPESFAELFGISKSGGDLEDYYDDMSGALRDAGFPDFQYGLFVAETGGMHLSEEEYRIITQKAKDLGVRTLDEIAEEALANAVSTITYDPLKKEYIK